LCHTPAHPFSRGITNDAMPARVPKTHASRGTRSVNTILPLSGPQPRGSGAPRRCSPRETLARLTPFFSAMGITRIADVTGLDSIGVPVVMVCRPNSRGLAVSQGKGLDLDSAKVSGLMEAAELFHAENIERPLVFDSFVNLRRRATVADPDSLPRTSARSFRRNQRLFWIAGRNLLNDSSVWVPNEVIHTDFRLPRPPGSGRFLQTSIGLAAGNDSLEAAIHGICEVIESDSCTMWDLLPPARRAQTQIQLDSVNDAACRKILAMFKDAEVAVAAWDYTSDLGVPTFACDIIPESDDTFRRMFTAGGSGCHPSRNVALLRALLEAAQSRLTVISGARDDISRRDYLWYRNRRVLQRSRARILAQNHARNFQDVSTFEGRAPEEVLTWLLQRLQAAGIQQVIAVDLTKPQINIAVVHVVIPGLEGPNSASRYSPGPRARLAARRIP
jgi:YcaO-like protein with predicted kinase domain